MALSVSGDGGASVRGGRGLGDEEEGREINQQPIFLYSELK